MTFLFVSSLDSGWGGSELLWSRTARLLASRKMEIAVSIQHNTNEAEIIGEIEQSGGIILRRNAPRPKAEQAALPERVRRWVARKLRPHPTFGPEETLDQTKPMLAVISQPSCVEGRDWMAACRQRSIPYVTIAQSAHPMLYHSDEFADRLEAELNGAECCYFVSDRNRRDMESFLARELPRSEVVRNPFNVDYHTPFAWPNSETLRLANVARLHIASKGQDVLLEVLAQKKWRDRPIAFDVYGKGANEKRLRALAERLKLDNVTFHGQVQDIQALWRKTHALLLPSRYEGLPIALVEAMLCGRPAVVTDVSGNSEVMIDGETGFLAAAPSVRAFDSALERLWDSRSSLQEMGRTAGSHIRSLVPEDPIAAFAERLSQLRNASRT